MVAFLEIVKGALQVSIAYRASFFLRITGNLCYLILAWFLWKAVYGSQQSMHGLDFTTTFLQIACAGTLISLFNHYGEWFLSHDIRDGSIIMRLLRPFDYQASQLARTIGQAIFTLFTVALPTFALLFFLFPQCALTSPVKALLFLCSIVSAFLITFLFDFIVGTISFYTESIWGFSSAKHALVAFLSGAMIPIAFFPAGAQKIITLLPFSSIYSTPLSLLLYENMTIASSTSAVLLQLFWVIILTVISRLFFAYALRSVTVNGG